MTSIYHNCAHPIHHALLQGDKLAVSGIRQEIIVWDMDTGCLVKRLIAHFQVYEV